MDCTALRSTKKTKGVQFEFENLFLKKNCCLKVGVLPVKTPFPKNKDSLVLSKFW